jgi:hypothetical protein
VQEISTFQKAIMKISTRFLLFIVMTMLVQSVAGQYSSAYRLYPAELNDTVSLYIQCLRTSITDSVIRFDMPEQHESELPAPDDFPHSNLYPNTSYIFYRSGNKTYVVKYYWGGMENGKSRHYFYTPTYLPEDTLFDWFTHHADLRKDYIASFTTKDTLNNAIRYQPWRPLHSPVYRICFYTPDDRTNQDIKPEDFLKKNHRGMININYEYNTSKKIFAFFLMLEQRCIDLFHSYR